MSDESWIKDAEYRIREAFVKGRIRKVGESDPAVMKTFIRNSRESLKVANTLIAENQSNLWTIVCSYYAMYYMANAVLYKNGYKVEGQSMHETTSDALVVYTRNRLKKSLLEQYGESMGQALALAGAESAELIKAFDKARKERGKIQYRTTEEIKKSRAKAALEAAKTFVTAMEKLLDEGEARRRQ